MARLTGNELAQTFLQYRYVNYVWGGSNPARGWDCSGACNWLLGVHFQLAIPGFQSGQFNPGSGHGPVVGDWINWIGVGHGIFGPVTPAPGDLIAWGPNVHMGMAINGSQLVSAENPQAGTRVDNIDGFFSWAPWVLRLTQVQIGAPIPAGVNPPGQPPGMPDWSALVSQAAASHKGTSGQLAAYRERIRKA